MLVSCRWRMRLNGKSFKPIFKNSPKQLDVILPDPAATPFLKDLKRFRKRYQLVQENRFRDEQLDIAGAGEKVRKLIEEHVYSTGVDSKIKPVDLLAKDFKEKLDAHKSSRSKAAEIETRKLSITLKSRSMMILSTTRNSLSV